MHDQTGLHAPILCWLTVGFKMKYGGHACAVQCWACMPLLIGLFVTVVFKRGVKHSRSCRNLCAPSEKQLSTIELCWTQWPAENECWWYAVCICKYHQLVTFSMVTKCNVFVCCHLWSVIVGSDCRNSLWSLWTAQHSGSCTVVQTTDSVIVSQRH